jgi:hypothetical protein
MPIYTTDEEVLVSKAASPEQHDSPGLIDAGADALMMDPQAYQVYEAGPNHLLILESDAERLVLVVKVRSGSLLYEKLRVSIDNRDEANPVKISMPNLAAELSGRIASAVSGLLGISDG